MTSEYIAGLFDGEGCIYVSIQPHGIHYKVSIAQKNRRLLELVKESLGFGKIRPVNRVQELCFESKETITRFLVPIIPHLVLRKREAEIMLQLCSIQRVVGRSAKQGDDYVKQDELILELREAFSERKVGE
jgi:LAGLIDADG DNA endonuclease family protein